MESMDGWAGRDRSGWILTLCIQSGMPCSQETYEVEVFVVTAVNTEAEHVPRTSTIDINPST